MHVTTHACSHQLCHYHWLYRTCHDHLWKAIYQLLYMINNRQTYTCRTIPRHKCWRQHASALTAALSLHVHRGRHRIVLYSHPAHRGGTCITWSGREIERQEQENKEGWEKDGTDWLYTICVYFMRLYSYIGMYTFIWSTPQYNPHTWHVWHMHFEDTITFTCVHLRFN